MQDETEGASGFDRLNPETWPAERVHALEFDEFGAESIHLWRCNECGGYFLRHDLRIPFTMTMGLIVKFDEAASTREQELRDALQTVAELLVTTAPCTCDYRMNEPER